MSFAAAVKTSALNWPFHRGTATAFPLAAFGLSAFFFSSLGAFLFPGDPNGFLKLLSCGTSSLICVGFLFLKVYPQPRYHAVIDPNGHLPSFSNQCQVSQDCSSGLGRHSLDPDIRGLKLLRNPSFWLLFTIMAILSGVGLMTINNIGNDVNVLWKHHDQSVTEDVLVHYQQMHVSVLSLCSFGGRLLSGVGSDFLATYLHASRLWCLLVASFIFLVSQACALVVNDPHFLGFVSGLSGLGYGFLFGVFPSLVAEAFGIRGLSQNWGSMTLAPVISSNIFNSFYGAVLDSHSVFDRNGERSCHDGQECYRDAYWATFGACFIGIAISLWAVQHERAEWAKEVNTME
ncbi:hypothetical protein E4U52_006984 [Claviceps spartinae]|nr:hypothetical protein E4U52_006984 [Claviceps spartinae]